MRAPASGREALAYAEPGAVYVDRETGEEMAPVAMVLPLAPSASALPRTRRQHRVRAWSHRKHVAADGPRQGAGERRGRIHAMNGLFIYGTD